MFLVTQCLFIWLISPTGEWSSRGERKTSYVDTSRRVAEGPHACEIIRCFRGTAELSEPVLLHLSVSLPSL